LSVTDRFEFRCWSPDFPVQKAILESDWRATGEDCSRETYLLGSCDRFSVKLRDGRFEVKERLGMEGRLELWRPVAGIAFPLSMDELAPWLEQAFGLSGAVTAGDEELDEGALKVFLTRHETAHILPVVKHRYRYELAGVLAEHVAVEAASQHLQSVGVEGEEPSAVFTCLRLLKIDERENLSYTARLLELAKQG
jgi:hypothetical protein